MALFVTPALASIPKIPNSINLTPQRTPSARYRHLLLASSRWRGVLADRFAFCHLDDYEEEDVKTTTDNVTCTFPFIAAAGNYVAPCQYVSPAQTPVNEERNKIPPVRIPARMPVIR